MITNFSENQDLLEHGAQWRSTLIGVMWVGVTLVSHVAVLNTTGG
jgi:hypothetical protein